jgi:hypothetical protein
MVKFTAVCLGLWVLVGFCVYLRFAPIQSEHADTLNLLCILGAALFGVCALFLSLLLSLGWSMAFVAWVWKSEAFPIRIVRERKAISALAPVQKDFGVYTYTAPGMPPCPQCGRDPTTFYCSIHACSLCLGCVARHDSPGQCVYLPAFRAPSLNVRPKELPDSSSQSSKHKRGDVFGIS